jgi:hypothetical protein
VDIGFESCRFRHSSISEAGATNGGVSHCDTLEGSLTQFSAKISVLAGPCRARSSDIDD